MVTHRPLRAGATYLIPHLYLRPHGTEFCGTDAVGDRRARRSRRVGKSPTDQCANLHRTVRDLPTARARVGLQPVATALGLPKEAAPVFLSFLSGFFRRDHAAAGLFDLSQAGLLAPVQVRLRDQQPGSADEGRSGWTGRPAHPERARGADPAAPCPRDSREEHGTRPGRGAGIAGENRDSRVEPTGVEQRGGTQGS